MKGPLCILEGPDGGGKSTLAEALTSRGYAYQHAGPPEKLAFEHWVDLVRATDGPTVFDRLHLGSYVYGRAFRGKDDMSDMERWLFDGLLWRHDTLLVIARPPDWRLDQSLERGPDNDDAKIYEDPARRQLVRDLYDDVIFERGERVVDLPLLVYDFTDEANGLEATLAQIDAWVNWRASLGPRLLPDHVPAQGNLRNPRYVFVGEQPHCRAKILQQARREGVDISKYLRQVELIEAMTPPVVFNSLSGRYLSTALSRLSLSDYAVFNALQLDGTTLSDHVNRDVVEAWGDDVEWVALGKTASKELTRAGIEHRNVPHPQWVKRFKYKEGLTRYPKVLTGEAPTWAKGE